MRAALMLLLLALPAAGFATDVEDGERLARAHCASCHAIGRSGDSPRPPAPAFRDLHRRYPVEQLAEALAEGMVTGHPDMPEVRFGPEQAEAFIAYLRSLR